LALDAERRGMASGPGEGRPSGLAHDLAQLAGKNEVLLAFHARDFDRDDVAADLGHDQAGRGPHLILGLELAVLEARWPEIEIELLDVYHRLALPSFCDRASELAHDAGDLTLDVPDARLGGVRLEEFEQRLS